MMDRSVDIEGLELGMVRENAGDEVDEIDPRDAEGGETGRFEVKESPAGPARRGRELWARCRSDKDSEASLCS